MSGRLAIIAGQGTLPQDIARAVPDALYVTFRGVDVAIPKIEHLQADFEKLGTLFDGLRALEVKSVVFAGAMTRPALNPAGFDQKTLAVMPALMAAFGKGDDALLGGVIAVFEAEGFAVLAAHDVAPALVLGPGMAYGAEASPADRQDAARASDILTALSPQDVAQSCVVAGGLCLGIETIQGTDAMLEFVATTPDRLRRGARGVLVKTAKQGQDLRVDMPAIGPQTVRGAAAAGLAGIFVGSGKVIVLEQPEVLRLIEAHDLFLATL